MNIIKIVILLSLFYILIKTLQTIKEKRKESFESNDSNLIILSNDEIKDFILKDEDNFIKNLSQADLKARKSISNDDYLKKVYDSIHYSPSNDDINLLKKATNEADTLLKKDYKKISELDWKIALIGDIQYENGFPHTRKDIIFLFTYLLDLPYKKLVNILIHEKIHVFQRYYPNDSIMKNYMKQFQKIKLRDDLYKENSLLRSNPDLDEWIYKDKKSNVIYYANYSSDRPTKINDILSQSNEEHPFEKMAYEISNNLI
jgi:hypothetical protein